MDLMGVQPSDVILDLALKKRIRKSDRQYAFPQPAQAQPAEMS